jgi:hypothetical protein
MVVFVSAFCLLIYFSRESWRTFISPEFKFDAERLREQRRRRKAARR